ncbi:hypothetical protein BDF20DRAFT_835594 [Mycotypha africana]|uniref:uncharacterized protein n=1 Tax=Mycotypha africana TaxID=64632 RepID=UPI00230046C1|nr:uncharacterized protein BDF20DRAFT_835594 [Mycotypha africana]KAI8979590.1 hypothetical protein BDF20DRAFT_835594 [Mycotypha africana]
MTQCIPNNNQCTQNIHTLLDPNDPSIEKEYKKLAEAWKNQIRNKAPSQQNKDFIRLAWLRLMDHYLDQQWLESKQMLQCAQAWSSQQRISVRQAAHTMKIISLKSMRRSLETRREILQALDDSQLITSFEMSDSTSTLERLIKERLSIADSGGVEGLDGDELRHSALMKHLNGSTEEILTLHDEGIMTPEEVNRYIQFIGHDYNRESKVFNGESKIQTEVDSTHPLSSSKSTSTTSSKSNYFRWLIPSRSTPNMSFNSNNIRKPGSQGLTRSYDTYYEKLHQALPWKDLSTKYDSTVSAGNSSTDTDGCNTNNKFNWKSWFHGDDLDHSSTEPLMEAVTECFVVEEPFANEKVEADALLMTEFYKNSSAILDWETDDNNGQNESKLATVSKKASISSFRSHSKNPASPQQVQQLQLESPQPQDNSYPSYVKIGERDLITYTPRSGRKYNSSVSTSPTMTKSTSVPSQTTSATLTDRNTDYSDTLTNSTKPPSKERSFTIRGMHKKLSLPKLFGNKKAAAASVSKAQQSKK